MNKELKYVMKMKTSTLCLMLGTAMFATSCLSEQQDFNPAEGQKKQTGTFVLNLTSGTQFNEQTRGLDENEYRNTANYTVQLWQDNKKIDQWTGPQDPLGKELEVGSYTVKAFYGEELPYSRNIFYVGGSTTFTIRENDRKEVNVDCYPTCGRLSVEFDAAMATYYDDYSVEYSGAAALGTNTIAWAKDDTEPWYVAIGESAETFTYTIKLKTKDAYSLVDDSGNKLSAGTVPGTFTLQRNRAHKLSVKPKYISNDNGTFTLSIEIDETTNDIPKNYIVPVQWLPSMPQGTSTDITSEDGSVYSIYFGQEGRPAGTLYFSTTKPITISAFDKDSGNQINLDGTATNGKIDVLCTGNNSHFSVGTPSCLTYSNKVATLTTPLAEQTIQHAPVTITLVIGGVATSAKTNITIWPDELLPTE